MGYRYTREYCFALLQHGQERKSFTWTSQQRMDFIAMYRMGGEL